MSERPDNNSKPTQDAAPSIGPPDDAPLDAPNETSSDRPGDGDPMDQLRSLLVGPERELLLQIKQRLDDLQIYARDVSRILPDAVDISSERDQRLAKSLGPAVEDALTDSVRRNPRTIADAIFPIMGPAIRKAIIDALGKMVQSLNQALEFGLSPRALMWRIQAWRTGKSFAEVVMLSTLLFRVEQVFLIRGEDGILLQHIAADDTETQDGDMVSGMLTAITDFVQDSFQPDAGTALDAMQVGSLNVWIERGPHAVLALVIRGSAPLELREEMQTLMEQLHEDFATELADPKCDLAVYERARPDLEALLREAKKRKGKPLLAWITLAAVAGLIAWFAIAASIRNTKWQDFIHRLNSEPGIVITSVDIDGGRRTLRGLRDPLAKPIHEIYTSVYISDDPDDPTYEIDALQLQTFHATSSAIAAKRAQALLQPPANVKLTVESGVLRLEGPATYDLIERARRLGPTVAGVDHIQEDNLVAADLSTIVLSDAREVLKPPASVTLRFENGTLIAEGEAAQQWIHEARVLAKSIERVKRYNDRQLNATDFNDIVLADADRILSPPNGVKLNFDQGTLTATGTATGKWIADARVLARTIPGVRDFREVALTADDLTQRMMAQAQRLLAPPDSVQLELVGNVLTATGSATTRWIHDARLLARTLRDIDKFDDSQLQTSDGDDLVLQNALRVLNPPANVQVTFKDGTLTLVGKTAQAWIRDALVLARSLTGVTQVITTELTASDFDSSVLADAKAKLQPPASVTLAFDNGVLTATGSSKKAWLERAAVVAPLINHVATFNTNNVTVTDLADLVFAHVSNALRPPASVKLTVRGTSVVATGSATHNWLINARRIAPGLKDVTGVDLSGVTDIDQTEFTNAVARLRTRAIFFGNNASDLPIEQARQLGQLIADARQIATSAKVLGTTVKIDIVGHSDAQSANDASKRSGERANEMLKELIAQGIPSAWLTAKGMGNDVPYVKKPGDPPYASSRRVVFSVIVNQGDGR